MSKKSQSVLVVGFNTRPLAYSLNKAGYKVYAVDFFGDEDLYPYVEDSLIVINELNTNYKELKEKYSHYLVEYSLKMIEKYKKLDFLIIGSGLDDEYEGREKIIKNCEGTACLVNEMEPFRQARDILSIYELLKSKDYRIPETFPSEGHMSLITSTCRPRTQETYILKKKRGAGGTSVFRLDNTEDFITQLKKFQISVFEPHDWIIQEYIKGIPISCTTISNETECEIISINLQIIGEKSPYPLNPPKEFMYCGNSVPADLSEKENEIISEISKFLVQVLKLKGINGFDFVLGNKDRYPYLMEINPRIPGSIRASEESLSLNLMELYIDSFDPNKWNQIKRKLNTLITNFYVTKLIYFAPKYIPPILLEKINSLENVHDKTVIKKGVLKGEPVCTILSKGETLLESEFRARNIVTKISLIIKKRVN